MRDPLKSSRRWRYAGWLVPLVLVALPNCFLNSTGFDIPDQFEPGDEPRSGGIMCDIPKIVELGPNGDCADQTEIDSGMPMEHAAVALAEGVSSSLVIDSSPAAIGACGGPKKKTMQGGFPDGTPLCLNCAQQIPLKFPTAIAACVAKCVDLVNAGGLYPDEGAQAFCENNARLSTNFAPDICYGEACTSGGTLKPDFVDPRRAQEPVKWTDIGGAATFDENNLSKLTGVPGTFDSGARSEQLITHGDAWVEFNANETGVSHVVGVSHEDGSPDDPGLADIQFAISLNYDGSVYVLENGAAVIQGPFAPYTPSQRYRLRITDNNDGTASISYFRVVGVCDPGTVCTEFELTPQTSPNPSYPLRVHATLREPGATISNVTMVRIKDVP